MHIYSLLDRLVEKDCFILRVLCVRFFFAIDKFQGILNIIQYLHNGRFQINQTQIRVRGKRDIQ